MYAINQQTSAKNLIAKNANAVGFSFTNNNTFFKIELDNPLQAGDVIVQEVCLVLVAQGACGFQLQNQDPVIVLQ